jgi:hypothetical protein
MSGEARQGKGGAGTLVVLLGPPAVGKMATGMALSERTGFPLFHNHMAIEPILGIFPFGSDPYMRLVRGFRGAVIEEAATAGLPGLIFTWVWDFDAPGDGDVLRTWVRAFTDRDGRAVFVELETDLETRLTRNRTELRLREKASKRDVEASEGRLLEAEGAHRFRSHPGEFPWPEHLSLDNTHLEPDAAAAIICRHFGLPEEGEG